MDYDRETGHFTWRPCAMTQRRRAGYVGHKNGKQWEISINRVRYPAGQLAWLYVTGDWPEGRVYHKDFREKGNGYNNAFDNLTLQGPGKKGLKLGGEDIQLEWNEMIARINAKKEGKRWGVVKMETKREESF